MFLLMFLVCVVLIYIYFNRNKDYWKKRRVVQFDGVFWKFISGNRPLPEIYKDIYDMYPNEKYVGLTVGSRMALLMRDLNEINFVLQGDFQNFSSRGFTTNPNDVLADNILFIDDYKRWKLLRQKLSPVFTHRKLKNMFYIMERSARDFVEFIENNAEIRSKPFNALYTYATASIGGSIFGIDTPSKNSMDCPFIDMSWQIFNPTLLDNVKAALSLYFPKLYKLLHFTTFKKYEIFFVGVVKDVLAIRRKDKKTRHDFIDTCLELQESGILRDATTDYEISPSDEVLAAQAFFYFIAGTDPTASIMSAVLTELSYNPAFLENVHKELDEVFESCNGTLSYEDLDKLVYLEMVINEAMRKYPPVAVIQRICTNSTVLPSGLRIEKNTIIVIPIFAIHRDKKYYPEPDLYDPERFSRDNVSNLVKNTFLPFGGGNRICIGARYARLQVKVGLAFLLRRFTLREQKQQQLNFTPSVFALHDPKAKYDLILRG